MIFKRVAAKLRAQDWMAIVIELCIVVVGVFIGTWVANWNEQRAERDATNRMLEQLRPEIQSKMDFFESARTYYKATRPYADQALAAWAGDRSISDNQFVIAAYQASQAYGIGINAQNWALAFGGNQMRLIDDQRVRRDLAVVLTADYDLVGFNAVSTRYREHVRQVLPNSVQDRIRASCGDRNVVREGSGYLVVLPPSCPLILDPKEAAEAANALRAHPELMHELNWHLAAIANYLANIDGLESSYRELQDSLDKRA